MEGGSGGGGEGRTPPLARQSPFAQQQRPRSSEGSEGGSAVALGGEVRVAAGGRAAAAARARPPDPPPPLAPHPTPPSPLPSPSRRRQASTPFTPHVASMQQHASPLRRRGYFTELAHGASGSQFTRVPSLFARGGDAKPVAGGASLSPVRTRVCVLVSACWQRVAPE